MSGWHPDSRGVTPGGDRGVDGQAGDAMTLGFRHDDLKHAAILVAVYPAGSGGDRDKPPFRVETQTGYFVCVNPDDPAGTETWSDVRYVTAPHEYRKLPAAVKAAADVMLAYATGCLLPDRSDWDGMEFR